jgi:hypothetical protein
MAALFGMHSFGTGFLVQSLLALRLYQAFAISVTTAAAILFRSSICSAISCLVAVPIAARIGLINTMVFTDLPFQHPADPDPVHHRSDDSDRLVVRSQRAVANGRADSQLLCHGVVTPQERPAAASVTAVPKTFAWAAGSMISGYLLTLSTLGWPLLIAGMVKGTYDILLLIKFQKVRPHQRRSPHLRAEGAHARPSRWYNHPVMAPSNSQNNPAAANDATTNSATMPEGTRPPISGGSGAPIR